MRNFDVDEPEAAWLEGWTLDRQVELITRAQGAGKSDAIAYGVAGWLTALARGLQMQGNVGDKRWRYRQVLLDIGPPRQPRKGPSEGRRAKKGAPGGKVRRIARSGGTATLVALATPIILDDVEEAAAELVELELGHLASLPARGNPPVLGKAA